MSSLEIAFCFLGNNAGLSLVSGNNDVCGTLGNSVSSSSLSSVYQQNQSQSMYNPNGLNQQTSYPHTNDRKRLQSSCGLPSSSKRTGYAYESGYRSSSTMIPPNYIQSFNGSSSSQSTRNIYGSEYPSSSKTIHPNDIQSSSSVCNQYATANLADGHNQTNCDPYYSNLLAQQYYPQQQPTAAVSAINQPQTQIPVDQTIAPNRFTTSSDVGLDKNYQHLPR
jgi:hypothetical protein